MTAPDLPSPFEPFTVDHLARWPMGAERAELDEGEVVWTGSFDERDAAVARRAFPGRRVRVEAGIGLTVGPASAHYPESREWTDPDGTRWKSLGGMVLRRGPNDHHWVVQPSTAGEMQRNRQLLTANRAKEWAATVAEYASRPDDVRAAWRYLRAHPVFWYWVLPGHLADTDASNIDEAEWSRIEQEGWLSDDDGLANMQVDLTESREAMLVTLEHGPMLWPLDVPAEHRAGLRASGTPSHDPRLDVAEPTWERAIVALAAAVRRGYGDDRARVPDRS